MEAGILSAATGCRPEDAIFWAPSLTWAMGRYEISTPLREAAFLAQVAHESDLFTKLMEDLNYSAAALAVVWPEHFDASNAGFYARHPGAIANRAYANRMGNGDEASGDGWRFRGRGLLQLTGRDDYEACEAALGIDLVGNPDLLLQPTFAAASAGWEWTRSGLNALADAGQFEKITRRVNGGTLGETDRLAIYQRALKALGISA